MAVNKPLVVYCYHLMQRNRTLLQQKHKMPGCRVLFKILVLSQNEGGDEVAVIDTP